MNQLLRHAATMGEQEIPLFLSKMRAEPNGEVEWLSFHEQNGEFQPLFERLHFEYNARRVGFITVMQACVEQLLVYMHRAKLDQLPQVPHASMKSIENLLAYIRMNCSSPLTLIEAATKLSISERQLQRQLKKLTGMSFTTYVQHARLETCCQYLRESSDKISDIAALVGYQDMKFFNQLFKKMIGVTPSQYRQQQAERKKPLAST